MPHGQKLCPSCQEGCGPRTFVCKGCGHEFSKKGNPSPHARAHEEVSRERVVDVSPAYDGGLEIRVKILESTVKDLRTSLSSANKALVEILKVSRAFHDIPPSLSLYLKEGQWFGMNEAREIRPVTLPDADISFAQNGQDVTAAPWEDDDVFAAK